MINSALEQAIDVATTSFDPLAKLDEISARLDRIEQQLAGAGGAEIPRRPGG